MSKKHKNKLQSLHSPNENAKASIKEQEPESKTIKPIFTKKNSLAILLALLVVGCFVVFKDFLLQKKLFLFNDIGSDTLNQIYPFAQMIVDELKNGIPTWSFQQGMGQYVAPFNLGNPFHWLLYILGRNNVAETIGTIEFIKFIVAGLLFYAFLKQLKLSNFAQILGGLVYGLSGFLSVSAGWFTFFTGWAVEFAFLLFSLERLLQRNQWHWLPLAVAFIAADQPFNLFLLAEFCLIYLFVKFYSEESAHYKSVGKHLVKIILLSLVGLLMSSLMLSGNLYSMLNSPRVTGGASYYEKLTSKPILETIDVVGFFTEITRFFGNNLTGIGNKYQGWLNYMEAPTFYLGLVGLLLFPQIFVLTKGRQRKAFAIVAGLIVASLIFPTFRYLFWGFTGDYYRLFSLFIGVAILLTSLRVITAIQAGEALNLWLLGGTFVVLVSLLFYSYVPNWQSIINSTERNRVLIFLLILSGLLVAYHFIKKEIILVFLLVFTFVEVVFNAYQTLNKREIVTTSDWKEKIGYNDYTIEALEFIKKREKLPFYRVEKDYGSGTAIHPSTNDAMVQGYHGTSVYTAFNQKNQILFMAGVQALDLKDEFQTRWAAGLKNRPFLLGNVGVKYVLSKGFIPLKNFGYDSLTTFQDVRVYENPHTLPIGVVYDAFYTDTFFKKLSPLQKDLALMKGIVINDSEKNTFKGFAEVQDSIPTPTLLTIKQLADERKQEALQIEEFSNKEIIGKITVSKPKLLYLAIPFDEGWKVEVNGKAQEKLLVNYGMMGVLLPQGNHSIKLSYLPPYFQESLIASIVGLFIWGVLTLMNRRKQKEEQT